MDTMETSEMEVRRQTLLKFNYFLGYHNEGSNFTVTVKDLRFSTSFFSFLSSLPEVLDCNMRCGNAIMNIAVQLLSYCTTSQTDTVYTNRVSTSVRNLSYLPPHCRLFWMKSLFILLFKVSSARSHSRLQLIQIPEDRAVGY